MLIFFIQTTDKGLITCILDCMIQSYGGYFCYVGVPTQSTYYANHYPDYMADRLWHTTAIRNNFGEAMSDYGIPFIDFRYYTQSTLKDYITEHKPDIVICVRDETAFLSEVGNGITE